MKQLHSVLKQLHSAPSETITLSSGKIKQKHLIIEISYLIVENLEQSYVLDML